MLTAEQTWSHHHATALGLSFPAPRTTFENPQTPQAIRLEPSVGHAPRASWRLTRGSRTRLEIRWRIEK